MSRRPLQLVAGRYRLGALLGRGPGTTIHRGVDVGTGRPVAVKLAEDDRAALGLRREHEALLALRHPHLPEVHQLGVDPAYGRAYLSRELVVGDVLDRFAAGAAEAELLVVLQQLTRALAFLHANGVVHGDVKPPNVLVRRLPDGGVWTTLIDLGFALEADAPPGTVFRGTPSYSPARLLHGAARGASDDVYALARTLLELRPPEFWPSAVAMLLRDAASEDPDLRPPDARALLVALEQAEPSLLADEHCGDAVAFVGRDVELEALERWIDDDHVGVVVVEGPSGAGKTALLRALRTRLVGTGRHVLRLEERGQGPDPAEALVRLLAFGPSVRAEEREFVLASIGRDALGRRRRDLGARPADPRALEAAICRLLAWTGRRGGAVVLLDQERELDAHARGPLTDVLARLGGERGVEGVTVVVAARELPAALVEGRRTRRLVLEELLPGQAEELVRSLLDTRRLGRRWAQGDLKAVCDRVVRICGGHPGLLEAAARGLSRELLTTSHTTLAAIAERLPRSLDAALDARLDALRGDARHVLDVLALQEQAVDGAMLAELVDLSDSRRRAALDELQRGGFVVHSCREPDRRARGVELREGYRVVQGVVAARVRARLGPAAADLHARTVEVLAVRRGTGDDALDELARHAVEGGRDEQVARYVPPAAHGLLDRGLPARAVQLARLGLDLLAESTCVARAEAVRSLGLTLADALLTRGDLQAALRSYDQLARALDDPADVLRVSRQRAECLVTMGAYEEAERGLAAIEPHVLDAVAPNERALLAGTRARLAFRRGHTDAATRILRQGLEQAQGPECQAVAAELWNNLGVVAFETGRFEESEEWHRRALEVRTRIGDERGVSFSLGNLANLAYVRGRLQEARDGYLRALELKRRSGESAAIATSLSNLGLVARSMGRFAEALARHEEALELREEMGDEAGRSRSLAAVAELMSVKGCHGRALQKARLAVEVAQRTGERDAGLASALTTLAEVAAEVGAADEAAEAVRQGLALCVEVGLPNEGALLEALAAAADAWGERDVAAAEARLQRAVADLRAGGDRPTLARALVLEASLALAREQHARAGAIGEELLALGSECSNPLQVALARYVLGVSNDRADGDATRTAEWLHAALQDAERMGLPGLQAEVQAALACFHEAGGRPERAARWSLRCLESLRAELSELAAEDDEVAFLGHPRRRRLLQDLSRRAGRRSPAAGQADTMTGPCP